MSKPRLSRRTLRVASKDDSGRLGPDHLSAVEENVQAIKRWERTILLARSKAEQVSDWIACTAGGGPALLLHVVWFGGWEEIAVRG